MLETSKKKKNFKKESSKNRGYGQCILKIGVTSCAYSDKRVSPYVIIALITEVRVAKIFKNSHAHAYAASSVSWYETKSSWTNPARSPLPRPHSTLLTPQLPKFDLKPILHSLWDQTGISGILYDLEKYQGSVNGKQCGPHLNLVVAGKWCARWWVGWWWG